MAKRKRRKHPGVVLIKAAPRRRIGWRARYVDPDTGKQTWVSLDPALTTRERREGWAARKSRALAQRRLDLEAGATRATGASIADAVERYYAGNPQLRETTLAVYRAATNKLTAWAGRARVKTADDLTRAKLMAFRERLIHEPKHAAAKNGKRGQKAPTGASRRSPHSVNQELRSVRTVLGYLVDLDLFSKLSHDDLRRVLKRLPAPVDRLSYLKPKALQRLLEAAVRHDESTFVATRDEHAGRKDAGSTTRYEPIAPFVATVLLTGARFGEMIDLDWSQVDLEALDSSGKAVGEIYITSASKTSKARTIGLEISPALRRLLAAQRMRTGGKSSVFALNRGTAQAARKRLCSEYGAPAGFGWQALRRTCGTFLTNAPGIFGGASAYRSAKQLGHSVAVAERHYVDLARGIPPEAKSLEASMMIEAELQRVIESVGRTGGQLRHTAT